METFVTILILTAGFGALAWAGRAHFRAVKPQHQVGPSASLNSLLDEDIDASLAHAPHTFRRPHALQSIGYAVASAVILTSFLITFLSGGWSLLSLLLAVAEVILLFTHGTPLLISITRTLTISPEGIEARDLFGHRSIEWWEVQRFLVTEDLSRFRTEGIRGRLIYETATFPTGIKLAVYRAVRAHLVRYQRELEPWTRAAKLVRVMKANALSLSVFAAAMILTAFAGGRILPQGNVLGLRCAYASDYLRKKYDLPDRHGCVVLRVNEGTGAYEAGLREGDMIVGVEGVPITSGPQFTIYWETLRKHKQEFTVVRPSETDEVTLKVTLGGHGRLPEFKPDDPYFYYLRARDGDDSSQAIRDFAKAIELAPDFDLAYVYRGALYTDANVPDLAAADFAKAIELDPKLSEAYRERAWLHLRFAEREAAAADSGRANELDSCDGGFQTYNYDCHINQLSLSLAYGERGDADNLRQGVEEAEKAAAFYPERPRSYYLAAYYLASLEDFGRARDYAAKYLTNAEASGEPGNLIDWAQRLLSGNGIPDKGEAVDAGGLVEPSALFLEPSAPPDLEAEGKPSIQSVVFAPERTKEPPQEIAYLTPDRNQLWVFFEFDNAKSVQNIYWEWTQNSKPQPAGFKSWPGMNKGRAWIRLENHFPNETTENTLLLRFDDEQPVTTNFYLRNDPYIGPLAFSADVQGMQPLLFYTGEPRQIYAHFEYTGPPPAMGLSWSADKDGAPVASGDIGIVGSGTHMFPIALPGTITPGLINVRLYLDGKPARNGALALTRPEIAASPPFNTFLVGLEPDGNGGLLRITRDISRNSASEFYYQLAPLHVPSGSTLAIAWLRNREPFLPPNTISSAEAYNSVLDFVPGKDGFLEPGEYEVVISLDTEAVIADVVVVR